MRPPPLQCARDACANGRFPREMVGGPFLARVQQHEVNGGSGKPLAVTCLSVPLSEGQDQVLALQVRSMALVPAW